MQDLVEQVGAVVVRSHAVAQEDEHGGAIVNQRQQFAECGVKLLVHLQHGVAADGVGGHWVKPWMAGVVEVPLLVADGVALAKDGEEEVPLALGQQRRRKPPLSVEAAQQPFEQEPLLFGRALRAGAVRVVVGRELTRGVGIEAEHRMQAERRLDLDRRRRWPGVEAEMPIVAAPLHHLHAVDCGTGSGVRDVKDRNPPARVAQRLPERRADGRLGRRESAHVGGDIDLVPAMEPVTVRAEPGGEGHPQRADE